MTGTSARHITRSLLRHESIACMCAQFITHLFACSEYPPATIHPQAKPRPPLHQAPYFGHLRFPDPPSAAQSSLSHRSGLVRSPPVHLCLHDRLEDSNKSWGIVAQGMFSLQEINQMERGMCNYLDWELTVDNPILRTFEKQVIKDFSQDRSSYPNYPSRLHFKTHRSCCCINHCYPSPRTVCHQHRYPQPRPHCQTPPPHVQILPTSPVIIIIINRQHPIHSNTTLPTAG